ncbi:MAG: serine hydrolase [Kordiimonadaceae bacterium]|nr:serine hydrolase [Kordiimonadaceae bacterium]MBO6568343.1 serine hydrolase [Kordiimonadaceae bacterium]MBO6963927.1 serine hydrolase [Kordiimonadaceae bacterium]
MKIWVMAAALCVSTSLNAQDNRPEGVTGATWQFGPLNRWAYTHLREVLPTKDIANDYRTVQPIEGIGNVASDLVITLSGKEINLSTAMKGAFVDGILVLKDGRAVVEIYDGTLTPERTHLLWSVSKTITGLTAASLEADGLIDLSKTVADYVPELSQTGWGDNSLRALLDMRDTSDWNEDYAAADSTVRRQDCADGLLTGPMCAGEPVVGNYVFLPTVGRDDSRKDTFVYKSGTTDVIAWVLEAATGQRFADLVSERIWKPMGAERSAAITVDVGGFTLASGGMMATLRDIARVGQLMLDRGAVGDTQIVPAAWMDDIFNHPGDPSWSAPSSPGSKPYYRSFVWGVGDGMGTVRANGVHGQFIDVSPSTNTVVAVFSSWPDADGGQEGVGFDQSVALIEAVKTAVN